MAAVVVGAAPRPIITPKDIEKRVNDALASGKELTLETFVDGLPESYRKNYTEVFDSRSLQGGTPEKPRILAYGGDARTIFAYGGDAKHGAFNRLEVIHFDRDAKPPAFQFYELEFPITRGGEPFSLGKPNPDRCKSCHAQGGVMRPIFDAYFMWPGMYGSEEDHLFREAAEGDGTRELELRKKYLAHKPNNDRYKKLADHKDGPKYQTAEGVDAGDRPNEILGGLLTGHLTAALAGEWAADPKISRHRYLVLAALSCGATYERAEPLTPFLPKEIANRLKKTEAQAADEVRKLAVESVKLRRDRQREILGTKEGFEARRGKLRGNADGAIFEYPSDMQAKAKLKFVFDNFALPMHGWSLDFDRKLAVHNGNGAWTKGLETELWERWITESGEPELYAFRKFASVDPVDRISNPPSARETLFVDPDGKLGAQAKDSEDERLKQRYELDKEARPRICEILKKKVAESFRVPEPKKDGPAREMKPNH